MLTSVRPGRCEIWLPGFIRPEPLLFAVVMDSLTDESSHKVPWIMMFADAIVFCAESREQVGTKTWRGGGLLCSTEE